ELAKVGAERPPIGDLLPVEPSETVGHATEAVLANLLLDEQLLRRHIPAIPSFRPVLDVAVDLADQPKVRPEEVGITNEPLSVPERLLQHRFWQPERMELHSRV